MTNKSLQQQITNKRFTKVLSGIYNTDTCVQSLAAQHTDACGKCARRSGRIVTCLALKPRRRALSGRVGLVMRTIAGCCLYSQHRTRCTNLITSDCFLLHSSETNLYAPATNPSRPARENRYENVEIRESRVGRRSPMAAFDRAAAGRKRDCFC